MFKSVSAFKCVIQSLYSCFIVMMKKRDVTDTQINTSFIVKVNDVTSSDLHDIAFSFGQNFETLRLYELCYGSMAH